ncbi:unnamed protein product [Nippostrongylus brasiliensis]|uniref:28S ribosomal protein S24, mitochondrial (inferred by orthology to a C. elegans protein) n=1 Tax=Nippostrongylus brasiliensis TaxID=27835 RepID=A0A0N4YXJ8_NIPBR|nr:unnamed protein product [Nippostrongylus brasiliensis]
MKNWFNATSTVEVCALELVCCEQLKYRRRSTVNRSQLLTYEMAQKPHHIGVRKSWLSWHSQNLEGKLYLNLVVHSHVYHL